MTNSTAADGDVDIYVVLRASLGHKHLKVGHINLNGIINKLHEIHLLLKEVEIHLTDEIADDRLGLQFNLNSISISI